MDIVDVFSSQTLTLPVQRMPRTGAEMSSLLQFQNNLDSQTYSFYSYSSYFKL
jgi:hypothetical protein